VKTHPLISVALCTFNGEAFLEKQLDSLLLQSYPNVEIVVIDDRSTDETFAILTRYAFENKNFRIFRNDENVGYTINFERALGHCKGEYIAICDQDDIWHPDKLTRQFDALDGHLLIYHDSEFIDADGISMNLRISDKFNFYAGSEGTPFLFLNCVSGHTILMKRKLLELALPFPLGHHYDQWLAYLASTCGSVHYLDQSLVQYRQHTGNSTDILATRVRSQKKEVKEKVEQLSRESEWLGLCSDKASTRPDLPVHKLYHMSLQRNKRLISVSFGVLIWKHRHTTLLLLKKGIISKLFFTLRMMWGAPAKQIM
jgi:glycosyltransferase involved in cell wall biosynthesis